MPKFVMHKHKASTLHYDFRLEISGVLKSWVIPKGPSANPADKRLAIEVEEHALSYMFFEGNIQEGKYGAGEVIIWDRGEYTSKNKIKDAYEKGHMELSLNGEKLKGTFRLIKMKEWSRETNKWLFIKKYDSHVMYDDITEIKPGSVVSMRRIK